MATKREKKTARAATRPRCSSVKEVKALKAKDLQNAVKGAENRRITLDMALFGRMVTSDAFRDVEASM